MKGLWKYIKNNDYSEMHENVSWWLCEKEVMSLMKEYWNLISVQSTNMWLKYMDDFDKWDDFFQCDEDVTYRADTVTRIKRDC